MGLRAIVVITFKILIPYFLKKIFQKFLFQKYYANLGKKPQLFQIFFWVYIIFEKDHPHQSYLYQTNLKFSDLNQLLENWRKYSFYSSWFLSSLLSYTCNSSFFSFTTYSYWQQFHWFFSFFGNFFWNQRNFCPTFFQNISLKYLPKPSFLFWHSKNKKKSLQIIIIHGKTFNRKTGLSFHPTINRFH